MPAKQELNLQQALPIWTPAWPTWIEMTSRIFSSSEKQLKAFVSLLKAPWEQRATHKGYEWVVEEKVDENTHQAKGEG